MAHQLEISADGEASMAYVGQVPWHGLGVSVPADLSDEQFMEKARLNWEVKKVRNYFLVDEKYYPASTYSLVRSSDNKELTTVSSDWEPVQNAEAFAFFREFINEGEMSMHTAGALKDGRIVWALAKINDGFSLWGKDHIEPYLLFTNPHIYGRTIDIRFTGVRVVCNNTLTLSLSGKSDLCVKLNHSRKFDPNLVKKTLGIATGRLQQYKTIAEFIGSKKFTKPLLLEYFKEVFEVKEDRKKLPKAMNILYNILDTQPGAKYGEGTWWHAYNTVTYATDHLLGRTPDTRIQSAWYGANKIRKYRALELAASYAEAA